MQVPGASGFLNCACALPRQLANLNSRDQLYFDRAHIFMPMLQQCRYFKRSKSVGQSESHTCLQYAMWTMAAALSSQFHHIRGALYSETLEKLRGLELARGSFEDEASGLEQTQAWILVAIYEFMQVNFQRAWTSAGRAIRQVQLMRLNEVDAFAALDTATDDDPDPFVEKEEKRRTFWVAFCLDRFGCALDGLPLTLSEQEIVTRLPTAEDAFQSGTPASGAFLLETMAENQSTMSSPFTECIIFSTMLGRGLAYQQQSIIEHIYGKMMANTCERQTWLDNTLSRQILRFQQSYLSASIRIDSMLLFTSMIAQATVLLLCKAAESTPQISAEKHSQCQTRALSAAKEIARLSKCLLNFSFFKVSI
ncbi:fungal-specific transcription factor domain-containing protein [Bisporella sp. PMI_857]|nr:fungal-specific transcription factor domain-containing protein [Bisporella sp. PMI_857]